MPFRSIRTLDGTLWVSGPREATPPTALRRNRGLSLIPNARVARSRAGSTAFGLDNAVVPLTRFSSIVLGRKGPAIINVFSGATVLEGTIGNGPLTGQQGWAIAPSVADNAATAGDFFYLADTSGLYKLDSSLAQSTWGIEPPFPGGITSGVAQTVPPILLDALDATAGWATDDVGTFATNSTIQVDGTSLEVHVASDTVGTITKTGLMLDLTAPFTVLGNPIPCVDEDWISFAVRFNKPRRVDSLQLVFGCDDDFNRGFSFDVLVDDRIGKRGRRSKRKRGVADIPTIKNDEAEFKATTPGVALTVDVNDLLGDSVASAKDNTWARLRIPKLAFTENGDDPDWSSISAIKFVIRTNRKGAVIAYLDDLKLQGGVGMQGTYKYLTTWKNSVTGHRGNANPDAALVVEDVERQPVRLSNFPDPIDPQIDTREFWRTLGNGEVYFFLDEQPIGEIEFFDDYADYDGLHGEATHILGDEVLPTDNILPLAEYGVPTVHANRMWWATGRKAYYSPPGRYESVAGFIDVTPADDAIVFPIRWDDQLFLLCEASVYVVLGTEEPFLVRKLPGVPGTITNTSSATPAIALPSGVVYLTKDGPRLLRGTSSQLLDPEGLASVFQEHRSVDGLVGTNGANELVAERDRVFLCWAGIPQTLVYDFTSQTWRDFGLDAIGGFYDPANDWLYLGTATKGTLRYGDESRTVDGDPLASYPIDFVWEPSPVVIDADRKAGCVRYCAFTIHTAGQDVTPTIIVDDVERVLPPFHTDALQVVEYPINQWGRVVSVRLTASLTTGRVEIAEVAFDVYLPETHGIVAPAVDIPAMEGAAVQPQAADGSGNES